MALKHSPDCNVAMKLCGRPRGGTLLRAVHNNNEK